MKRITVYQAAYAILRLPDLLDYKEPIGALNIKSLKNIESCIEQPFACFGGKYRYWFIYQRAAAMFYYLDKNHALDNGNKRSAVAVTMTFLYINKKWFDVTPDTLYKLACEVAKSNARESDKVIDVLSQTFKDHIHDL